MEVAFVDDELSRLCTSRTALEGRWGPDWVLVARRLVEIAASPTLAAVVQLPFASVIPLRAGEFDVTFNERLTVRLEVQGGTGACPPSPETVSAVTVTAVACSAGTAT
jgi:hypothetical protein